MTTRPRICTAIIRDHLQRQTTVWTLERYRQLGWTEAQLLALLAHERRGDIRLAWDEIQRRGRGWQRRITSGLNAVATIDRATGAVVKTLLQRGG